MNCGHANLLCLILLACSITFCSAAPSETSPAAPSVSASQNASLHLRFSFGTGQPAAGWIQIFPTNIYNRQLGYGLDFGSKVTSNEAGSTSEGPFFFSVALPEGNYNVTVRIGNPARESSTTVKTESRRLMLENIHTEAGQMTNCTFTVNVRTPDLPSGGQVRLKPRELGPPLALQWDDKLTIEFNGSHPGLSALEITKADEAITVFLAGDSTVTDQPREPWNSWGQMLPRFFKPGAAIANHAESGESLPSFLGSRRFEKIASVMKLGDYLFIQFGHNDQKDRRPNAGPFTTYKSNLLHLITESRKRGATPVLVTPMERKSGVLNDTLGEFPAAVRDLAKEINVPLIDLHSMSKKLYAALGDDLGRAFQDGTHHNSYGSYELAKCLLEGIKANKLDLVKYLLEDVAPFDPAHPDPVSGFKVPASPVASFEMPEGN